MSYYQIKDFNDQELKDFHKKYKQVRSTNDERFGKVNIYRSHQNEKDLVFTIVKNFQSEKQQKDYVKELLLRDQMGENQLKTKIRNYHQVKNQGMCGSTLSVTLFVDYFEASLENEIKRRAKDNNRFEENELWYILESLAGLFAQWQEQKFFHGDIYANNIAMNSEGELKVWDNAVVSQHANSLVKAFSQKNNCYLSPVQMDSFAQKNTKINYDVFKADVFALGMLMMEIAQLRSSNQYYVWGKSSINSESIERDLAEMNQIYSDNFVQQVREMLIINADVRPHFIQLSSSIERNRSQVMTYQPQMQQAPVVIQEQAPLMRSSVVQQPVVRSSVYQQAPIVMEQRPTIVDQAPIMRSSVVHQAPIVHQTMEQRPPIVHQAPMVYEQSPVIQQSNIVHQSPVIQQSNIVHQSPVIHQNPMIIQQEQAPMMYQAPRVIEQAPQYTSQSYSTPMTQAPQMMSGSTINRSPMISNSNLSSSTINRGPMMSSPMNMGASSMTRSPVQSTMQSSTNGAISQSQMDAMLSSGVVKRGPNGELKA